MIKAGDKVRFIVDEPSHGAVRFDGEMSVIGVRDDEEGGVLAYIKYPPFDEWVNGLHQEVCITDVELI